MDVILYLYWLNEENYPELLSTIIKYLKEIQMENVRHSREDEDIEDIYDCIVCKILRMNIRTEWTNKDWDSELTQEIYQIKTNVDFFINISSDSIIEGENVLKGMIKRLEELYHPSMIFEDNSSKVVYMYSGNKKYLDKDFWNLSQD